MILSWNHCDGQSRKLYCFYSNLGIRGGNPPVYDPSKIQAIPVISYWLILDDIVTLFLYLTLDNIGPVFFVSLIMFASCIEWRWWSWANINVNVHQCWWNGRLTTRSTLPWNKRAAMSKCKCLGGEFVGYEPLTFWKAKTDYLNSKLPPVS